MSHRPPVLMIAGPNGAGKSTAAPGLVRDLLGVVDTREARVSALRTHTDPGEVEHP